MDTYHHIGNRTQYFAKLKSSLRPTGRLAIVDFKADSPSGPPAQYRISPEKVTEELGAAGYSLMESLFPFVGVRSGFDRRLQLVDFYDYGDGETYGPRVLRRL